MDINKAIAILEEAISQYHPAHEPDLRDAQQLGVEALKAIRSDRLSNRMGATTWLKGELK